MTGQPLRLGSDGHALVTRPGSGISAASQTGLRRLRVSRNITPNKSFKPNLLRYGNGVAEIACHAVASTAQVGLTQALGPMRKIAVKLGVAIAAMPLSLLLIGLTHNGFFFLFFLISLPLIVLYWIDLGREIRSAQNLGPLGRILGILMGLPQALFGLLCAAIGLAIVIWVLYNTFVERQPQYSGGFLTLGIGPALVLFGLGWVVSAFRSAAHSSDGA